jgi:hypothetical protein
MLMNKRPTVTVPPEIEEAQLQFENWRCERKRGQRIPKDLWGTAVGLAKQHGVWPTARALNLDHNRLKRRVGDGDDEVKSGGFVELIAQGAMLCTCIVEMEDARGARMRIELKGAAADVTALSRTFWSERE